MEAASADPENLSDDPILDGSWQPPKIKKRV